LRAERFRYFTASGGHATGAGAGHRGDDVIRTSPRGIRHTGRSRAAVKPALRDDLTIPHLQLARKNLGVRPMADRNENSLQRLVEGGARLGVFYAHARNPRLVAQHFVEHVVPKYCGFAGSDFSLSLSTRMGWPELVAGMPVTYARCWTIQRFLDRGIASADHRNILL
jgi:hypothetical protein